MISSIEIKKNLEEKNINISKNTVINVLHELDFIYKFPISKPKEFVKDKFLRLEMKNIYFSFLTIINTKTNICKNRMV